MISCFDLSGVDIQLELMENGNLQDYLTKYQDKLLVDSKLSKSRLLVEASVQVEAGACLSRPTQ